MREARHRHPEAIVGTDWLAGHLDDAGMRVPIRIYDFTTYLAASDNSMSEWATDEALPIETGWRLRAGGNV